MEVDIRMIRELFVHRDDVFSVYQEKNGSWYPRKDRNQGLVKLDDGFLRSHLLGQMQIGLYSTARDEDYTVKWVVADFDDNILALDHCVDLKKKLHEFGISSHIEVSFSGKGYHLWVFFTKPIPAAKARRFMLYALYQADVPLTGVFKKGSATGRSMDRLFPAQDFLGPIGFGNLIRMPLYLLDQNPDVCVFVDEDEKKYPDQLKYIGSILEDGRVDPDFEGIEEILAGEGPRISVYKPPTKDDSDYWSSLPQKNIDPDRMRGCAAIQAGIEDANQFNEPTWQAVMTNIAAHGTPAETIAHDFSKGYDMSAIKGDSTFAYEYEETQKKFFRSLDNIQRGQIPNTCQSLSGRGWTCPNLTSCEYRFIAQYGMLPSETVYPATDTQKEWMRVIESEDLYETFSDMILISDELLVKANNDNEHDYIPPGSKDFFGKFKRKPITQFDLHRHMFIKPIQVRYYDILEKEGMMKWIRYTAKTKKDIASIAKVIKEKGKQVGIHMFVQDMDVYLFQEPHTKRKTFSMLGAVLKAAGIGDNVEHLYINSLATGFEKPPFEGKHSVRGIQFMRFMKHIRKVDSQNAKV